MRLMVGFKQINNNKTAQLGFSCYFSQRWVCGPTFFMKQNGYIEYKRYNNLKNKHYVQNRRQNQTH